ncbi:MAG TPA: YraN family protein [Pseudacidobacterium sp.]|jgi:putative endonuclease|nr:YraN family protein [Pseudacidobacterium sp.]
MPLLQSTRLRLFEAFVNASARRRTKEPEHLVTGRRGELAAYFFLRRQDYIVVARGWRSARLRGDIDLIGWDSDTLCFVEVKTRTTRDVATAEAAVDEDKRRALRRLARQYIRQLPASETQTRFDILSIYFEKQKAADFQLFRGAFDWS